jgi:enoyl-CoA hydratase
LKEDAMSIVVEHHNGVEVVRINRPEAKNAINPEVSRGIDAAFEHAATDPSVRVAVLTGTGDTFCAGGDLKVVAAGRGAEFMKGGGETFGQMFRDFPKPIIAAVNGTAVAGGFELVLACDLVVAAETARFGLLEVKRGLFAAGGGLVRLPGRIPVNVAMELAIGGAMIDARRGFELGLVNRVVPTDQVIDAAIALAMEIAANAPLAVRASRAIIRTASECTEAEAWERNAELQHEVFGHPDSIEGSAAFAEKRAPVWTSS